jgi:hypothetical protein
MNFLPDFAQFGQMFPEFGSNALYLVLRESSILPQTQRAEGAIQV